MTNLQLRALSALLLAPLVLGAVYVGGFLYVVLIVAALGGAFYEWIGLTHSFLRRRARWMGFAGLAAALLSAAAWGWESGLFIALIAWLCAMLSAARYPTDDRAAHFSRAIWLGAGLPYLALSGIALIYLRAAPDGLFNLLYLLMVVWGTDIGGYFVGCTIRGPKICPAISPKKTWSGLFGGMALAALMGYLVALGFEKDNALYLAALAPPIAVVSQAGDFFESFVKRRAGAKDSGRLIPGHGGLLDRIDGLLAAAIFAALVMG